MWGVNDYKASSLWGPNCRPRASSLSSSFLRVWHSSHRSVKVKQYIYIAILSSDAGRVVVLVIEITCYLSFQSFQWSIYLGVCSAFLLTCHLHPQRLKDVFFGFDNNFDHGSDHCWRQRRVYNGKKFIKKG